VKLLQLKVKTVLLAGGLVFGVSAVVLVLAPNYFISLLLLTPEPGLTWSMRLMGITLIALSGNLIGISIWGSPRLLTYVGDVMLVSAALLGVLTLLIPAKLGWFTLLYSAVGFGFSAAYAMALLNQRRSD